MNDKTIVKPRPGKGSGMAANKTKVDDDSQKTLIQDHRADNRDNRSQLAYRKTQSLILRVRFYLFVLSYEIVPSMMMSILYGCIVSNSSRIMSNNCVMQI